MGNVFNKGPKINCQSLYILYIIIYLKKIVDLKTGFLRNLF